MTDDIYTVTRHELLRTPGRRRNEFSAGRAPLVTDDETQGFGPSSTWIRAETGEVYTCLSAAAGAALWRRGAGAEHDELQGLDQDDHVMYGIIYNTPNDPGTPPRDQAIWIDEDEDGGSGGAPAVHPHDADEVWFDDPGGLYPLTPLTSLRRPNEDGPYSGSIAPAPGFFATIDEPGASNRGDGVAMSSDNAYFIVWFPAWEGASTDAIVRLRVRGDFQQGAPTGQMRVYLRRKAEADGSTFIIDMGQSFNGLADSAWMTTNPMTGVGWTPDDLVNTGVMVQRAHLGGTKWCYQLYIEVEYNAGVTVQAALTATQTELDTHEASPHGGGGGGFAVTQVGTTTVGTSFQTQRIAYKKVTLATAGVILGVYAAWKGNGANVASFSVALFADNAGVPGRLLMVGATDPYNGTLSSFKSTTAEFVGRPLGAYVNAGTYWIAVMLWCSVALGAQLAYVATGPDYDRAAGMYWADGSLEAAAAASRDYSIYCTVMA